MIAHLFGATAEDPTRRRITIWRDIGQGKAPRWWAVCPCHAAWTSITWQTAITWADHHARRHREPVEPVPAAVETEAGRG